jgi:hypothetical protein
MITRVASMVRVLEVDVHPSDGAMTTNFQNAIWGHVSSIM